MPIQCIFMCVFVQCKGVCILWSWEEQNCVNSTLWEREIEEPNDIVGYTGVTGLTNWCLAGSQHVLEPLGTGKAGDIRLCVPALVAGLLE